ncbi:MAG: Hpt domain-containing protein [Rhodospirillales bacterium]|nr:Hpt domain-containing protein [Rhodospirillales bacterium]
MAEDDEAEIIRAPDTLKAKVGPVGPSAEDLRAIKKAEAVIANLAEKYVEIADLDLANLLKATEAFKTDPANRRQHLKKIFLIAHDMKGQGGSFGYPLVTAVCNQLCRFIETIENEPNPTESEIIPLYVNAVTVVLRGKIKDADSQQARALLEGLGLVYDKVAK